MFRNYYMYVKNDFSFNVICFVVLSLVSDFMFIFKIVKVG